MSASVLVASHQRLDPAKVFLRAGLLLAGVALTWLCAAVGLLVADLAAARPGCRARIKPAISQVRAIESAVSQYQIDQNRCPETRDDLVDNRYVDRKTFEDPWGTPISFRCDSEDIRVDSAGPDRVFGTADDLTAGL